MRSPEEQEDFLEHGRFGEGDQNLARTKLQVLVWIGLLFFAIAAACFGSIIAFQVGRDDGGPLLVQGAILALAIGAVLCTVGLVKMRSKGR